MSHTMFEPSGSVVRVSGLALWGVLLSVASVAVCVVAIILTLTISPAAATVVVALPLVSFLGAGLSGLGLRSIGRSRGGLSGRPLGIAGLLVGLMAGVLQGAGSLSAIGTMWSIRQELVPVIEAMLMAHGRGDRSAFRATLGETVSRHLSDERADWFFTEVSSRAGTPRGARFDLGVMIRAARRVREATANIHPGKTVVENPKPMEIVTGRGVVLAFVIPDDETMRVYQRVAIADMLVMLESGEVVTLRAEGPAAALAKRFGWPMIRESE